MEICTVADRGISGPAIMWGPLQGCDPMFPSWGLGSCKPPSGVRGRGPEAKQFGNNIENMLKIIYLGRNPGVSTSSVQ